MVCCRNGGKDKRHNPNQPFMIASTNAGHNKKFSNEETLFLHKCCCFIYCLLRLSVSLSLCISSISSPPSHTHPFTYPPFHWSTSGTNQYGAPLRLHDYVDQSMMALILPEPFAKFAETCLFCARWEAWEHFVHTACSVLYYPLVSSVQLASRLVFGRDIKSSFRMRRLANKHTNSCAY